MQFTTEVARTSPVEFGWIIAGELRGVREDRCGVFNSASIS